MKAAKDDTWRMKITADTIAARRSVSTGEILDLSVEDALDLMRSGKAERYVEPPVKAKVEVKPEPKPVEVPKDKDKAPEATKGGNK